MGGDLMVETATYTTSPYLRTVREEADRDFTAFGGHLSKAAAPRSIVYHSLLGHGRYADEATMRLLKRCEQGISHDELATLAEPELLEELFRMSYLVPAGFDDRHHIQDLLAERRGRLGSGELLSSLQLVLTNGCNFSCEYCFAYNFDGAVSARNASGEIVKPGQMLRDRRAAGNVISVDELLSGADWNRDHSIEARNPRGQMSVATAERTIDRAIATRRRAGGGVLSISFFGGEPTLNRALILHVLRRYGNGGGGVGIEYVLTTNGSRMDDELLEALAQYQVNVSVSIDYIDPQTGRYRGAAAQTVPWETVRENVLRLARASVNLHITTVLSGETWDRWNYNLIDFMSEAGIQELNVIVSFHANFFQQYPPKAVAQKLLTAFDYGQTKGVRLTGYWYHTYLLILDDEKRALQADYKTCPAIGRMLSIEPNGSVFSCKATNRLMGNVEDWDAIFTSRSYEEYAMRAYSNGPDCNGCELEGSCSGGSAGALEETGGITKMNRGYCEYIRTVVNGLLERSLTSHETLRAVRVG